MKEVAKVSDPPADTSRKDGGNGGAADAKIVVDGVEFTAKEIARLRDTGKNLERDYNRKTERLSATQKAYLDRETALKAREAELESQAAALREDYDFFTTQPVDKWDGYSPKVVKAGAPNVPDKLAQKLERVEKLLESLEGKEVEREAEQNVDKVFSYVEGALAQYETVTETPLLAMVSNYVRENGKNPSKTEVEDMAGRLHRELVQRGVTVRKKEEVAKLVDSGGVKPPPDTTKRQLPDMRNFSRFITESEKWLADYQARTGR